MADCCRSKNCLVSSCSDTLGKIWFLVTLKNYKVARGYQCHTILPCSNEKLLATQWIHLRNIRIFESLLGAYIIYNISIVIYWTPRF